MPAGRILEWKTKVRFQERLAQRRLTHVSDLRADILKWLFSEEFIDQSKYRMTFVFIRSGQRFYFDKES